MLPYYRAGSQRWENVASTSMQRHDVASRLMRRCIDVMCPLGIVFNIIFSLHSISCSALPVGNKRFTLRLLCEDSDQDAQIRVFAGRTYNLKGSNDILFYFAQPIFSFTLLPFCYCLYHEYFQRRVERKLSIFTEFWQLYMVFLESDYWSVDIMEQSTLAKMNLAHLSIWEVFS